MRGRANAQGSFLYSVNVEAMIPADHPLREIRRMVDDELKRLRPAFEKAYSSVGRPSIPPEWLIKATLVEALYSIRSERQLCEQIAYNFLFRWFIGMDPDEKVWNHATFSKNRQRFAEHGLMRKFFEGAVARAIQTQAAGSEHFSVDGTLIQAWGSIKSLEPREASAGGDKEDKPMGGDRDDAGGGSGGAAGAGSEASAPRRDSNKWVDFHDQKRTNETHVSKTDPEARLARKGAGQAAILAHSMHTLMDNRNGLLLEIEIEQADGTAERRAALSMIDRVKARHWLRPSTLGADKGYDDGSFMIELERINTEPHIATREGEVKGQGEAADARRRCKARRESAGYRMSQKVRRRIEETFGWLKGVAGLRKSRWVGQWKISMFAQAAGAAYNLLRLARLPKAA